MAGPLDHDQLDTAYRTLECDLERDGVRLVQKDQVWHQRVIGWLLAVITLGAQRHYLDRYVTTLGRTIYVTPDWEARPLADRYVTLRHELVHVAQFRRYGVGPMAIAYLLLPLPFGLAWCRMALERQAYAETVRLTHTLYGRVGTDRLRAHVVAQFTTGSYGWMWPFPRAVGRWYDRLVDALEIA
jgi:hypothetical protein